MFKKKGSSTLVAIVCCLVCVALGIFYGLRPKDAPVTIAPAKLYAAEHPGVGTVSIEPAPRFRTHVKVDEDRARISQPKGVGTASFSRPVTGATSYSRAVTDTATATATMP